jgi:hypothetical protein
MFGSTFVRWMAGSALALTLATNLFGTGIASAHSLTATSTFSADAAQLAVAGDASVASGSMLTINGTSYGAGEPVSFWINVPAGTTFSNNSLGQTDSAIVDNVAAVDAMALTDDNGSFSFSLNTAGLPSGSYTLVAHGMNTYIEKVISFTINTAPATNQVKLTVLGDTTVAAGTVLTINGANYQASEPVGFWINVPKGTSLASDSLGQTDSYIVANVAPLDAMATADTNGAFSYSLNTSGLPAGTYSMVAHGLESNIDGVVTFTIK